MKKNALGLYFLSLSLFALFSCNTGSGKADQMLQSAENVVEQLPDSALRLLDSIPTHYELNERQQAKYTLLYVQAKDKSYRDITFDTEIFSVKDYYIRKKDFPNAALALSRNIKNYIYEEKKLYICVALVLFHDDNHSNECGKLCYPSLGVASRYVELEASLQTCKTRAKIK